MPSTATPPLLEVATLDLNAHADAPVADLPASRVRIEPADGAPFLILTGGERAVVEWTLSSEDPRRLSALCLAAEAGQARVTVVDPATVLLSVPLPWLVGRDAMLGEVVVARSRWILHQEQAARAALQAARTSAVAFWTELRRPANGGEA